MKIIKNSYVFVRPLISTVQGNIEQYIRSCPIQNGVPTLDQLHATICRATEPLTLVPDDEVIYSARIKGAEIWRSPLTQTKSLVILLDSPDLVARREQVLANTVDHYQKYIPHITICYDVPPHNRQYRWWINEVLMNFNKPTVHGEQDVGGRYYDNVIELSGESIGDSLLMSDGSPPEILSPFV